MNEQTPLIPSLIIFSIASVATYAAYDVGNLKMLPITLSGVFMGISTISEWFNESISHY